MPETTLPEKVVAGNRRCRKRFAGKRCAGKEFAGNGLPETRFPDLEMPSLLFCYQKLLLGKFEIREKITPRHYIANLHNCTIPYFTIASDHHIHSCVQLASQTRVVFLILYVIEDMRKIFIFSMHTVRIAID